MDLSYIRKPIAKSIIKDELSSDLFVRHSNKGSNEIYIVNQHNAPNVVQEIGRLREVTFATAGGGTGMPVDLDEFDTSELCYEQLILFNPEDEEIVGGYRFIECSKVIHTNPIQLSTAHYFNFTEKFVTQFLPHTIELGRSWIQPLYQPSVNARKGIFTLDNLWDGLGAIAVDNPQIKHFFGKVTMYTNYNAEARDAVLYLMNHFFEDKEELVKPKHPLPELSDIDDFKAEIEDLDFKEAMKVLQRYTKDRGENIPPLINNYMQLSPSMKAFGTAANPDFGDVEETGILVTIDDIYDSKKERHISSYVSSRG
ncbi:MAG: GNAT family N-acetyltransferase [Bacteroidia bacterium]